MQRAYYNDCIYSLVNQQEGCFKKVMHGHYCIKKSMT